MSTKSLYNVKELCEGRQVCMCEGNKDPLKGQNNLWQVCHSLRFDDLISFNYILDMVVRYGENSRLL